VLKQVQQGVSLLLNAFYVHLYQFNQPETNHPTTYTHIHHVTGCT